MKNIRGFLETFASIATISTCGVLVWAAVQSPTQGQRSSPPQLPKEPVSLEGVATRGNSSASVVMIEYSDFQCPYCGQFSREILPKLNDQYISSGKVLLAFRHMPLAIHLQARKAAEAAECAARQGRFWEMHDKLFESPSQIDEASLVSKASSIGLNADDFGECLAGLTKEKVDSDAESARLINVSGTPAFLLGTLEKDRRVKVRQILVGARPVSEFAKALNGLLEGKVLATR